MQSEFAVNKYLHTVASGWIFINIEKLEYLWFWDICVLASPVWLITAQVHPQYCTGEQRLLLCTKTKLDGTLFFLVSPNLQAWWAVVHKNPIWFSAKVSCFYFFTNVINSADNLVEEIMNSVPKYFDIDDLVVDVIKIIFDRIPKNIS